LLPEYETTGVGRILKVTQRNDAIARGIDLIEWTSIRSNSRTRFLIWSGWGFVRRYCPINTHTSSPLTAPLPTEPLIAEVVALSRAITTRLRRPGNSRTIRRKPASLLSVSPLSAP